MKIYFGASIANGNPYLSECKQMVDGIQRMGHTVLSPFVVDRQLNERRFANLSPVDRAQKIVQEDIVLLLNADAVILERSFPSDGVGTEAGLLLGRYYFTGDLTPTLFLVHAEERSKTRSAFVVGHYHADLQYYTRETCVPIIGSFMKTVETREGRVRRERG